MCGSGPYERDEKGEIDSDKEIRTRTVEVLDLLDPNFKKVIHTNFPLRNDCFGGILNNTPFFGGGESQSRDLDCIPPPQVLLHMLQDVQGPHCPSSSDNQDSRLQ